MASDDTQREKDAAEMQTSANFDAGNAAPTGEDEDRSDSGVINDSSDQGTSPHLSNEDGKEGRNPKKKLSKKDILELLAAKNLRIEELAEKSAVFEAEAKELKDRWVRSVAEFENYRKRSRKEWDLLQRQSKVEVILEILDVVDDFERAISVVGDRDDDFVQGIRLIYNNLQSALDRIGVQKMDAMDNPFDPAYHMAVAQIDREGAQSNHIVEIVQEGYLFGDTVIRPAKAIIAK